MGKIKLLKIIIGLLIFGMFFYSLFAAYKYSQYKEDLKLGQFTGSAGMEVGAVSGTIRVKDFTANHLGETDYSYTLQETADYRIIYYKEDSAFIVTLLSLPLSRARAEAERYLQAFLGIEEAQMCRLKISVGVPYNVSEEYAGRDLGLGFCLDSEDL